MPEPCAGVHQEEVASLHLAPTYPLLCCRGTYQSRSLLCTGRVSARQLLHPHEEQRSMFNFLSGFFSKDEQQLSAKAKRPPHHVLPRPLASKRNPDLHSGAGPPGIDVDVEEGVPSVELKIVMVGGRGVGKTSIIRRYTQDLFSKTYVPTIGVDLLSVEIEQSLYRDLGPVVLLHFYDVAHAEVGGANLRRLFEEASGVVMVFDCSKPARDNAQSLSALDEWYHAMADHLPPEEQQQEEEQQQQEEGPPAMILLGNKCDSGSSAISPQSLDVYAQRCGYRRWRLVSAKNGAAVHEAIDALVRDLLREVHQREQESRNRAASKLVGPTGRKACEVDREVDCASDSGSGARSRESTAAISRENTIIVTTLATTTPPARTHVGGGDDEPKASTSTPARQTAQDHAAVMPADAVDDVPEGAAAKEAEAKQQRDDQVRKSRIAIYERKIAQIRELVEEFYRQLHGDLLQLRDLWLRGDKRSGDMERLYEQARSEHADIVRRLCALPDTSEVAANASAELCASVDLKKIHIAASEQVTKWQKLMHHLDTEIALSSRLTLRRSLATHLTASTPSLLSSPLLSFSASASASYSASSSPPPPPSSSTRRSQSSEPPMGCPPPALPAYATTSSSSSSSFMSSSSSLSGSGNRVAPAYSSFPSSSSTSPYSSPPSYIDTLAPHHQHPHQRQHPLLSSSLTSSPYSSFTSPSSSSSSSSSFSSSSTHYDRNNTPLSLSSSQLSLRHFSTAYMSGEVADEDPISAKLSSLASFEARPRSSRRRRKGFGFRNAGKSQEFDGCSSGEVTPLSSLTASFNSSPLSSQAVSDDEGDSSNNNNNNDYDGFLMGGAADDLASSGEIPRVSSSSRKDKAATTPHQVAHTQGGPDRTRRDDLAASGESRTPCSSPAPRRAVSSSSLLDMPPSAGIG